MTSQVGQVQELEFFVPRPYLDSNEHLAEFLTATLAMRSTEPLATPPQVRIMEWRVASLPHEILLSKRGGCFGQRPVTSDPWIAVRYEYA